MYRNLILASVVVTVLVGCGLPSVPTPQQGEGRRHLPPASSPPATTPEEAPPEWFPLAKFVQDIGDGRSAVAAQKPYQGRKYWLRLKVDDFNRTGYATCSFVGGGAEPLASIKLADGVKKGDVVDVVGTFVQYHPAGYVTPSYITFGYAGSAGGK